MSNAPKAAIIILSAAIAMYVLLFFVAVPAMTSRAPMAHAMGVNIYAVMYRPVRDMLPSGNFVLGLWRDYEAFWCSGSDSCEL